MASTFEGLGTGMLGTDRSYVNHNNPLSSALSGLKDFGIMYGMDKAGVFDYLNKMGEQKQTMMDKYPALAKKPDGSAAPPAVSAPVSAITGDAAPVTDNSATADNNQNPLISDEAADNLFKNTSETQPSAIPTKVLAPSTFQPGSVAPPPVGGAQISGVSPNVIQLRNMGQDQLAMDMASAPPSQMNLKQYGQPGSSGIGSKVATAFVTKLLTSLI